MRRALALLVLASAWPTAGIAQGGIDRQIQQNRDRLEAIRRERADLEGQLTAVRTRVHSLSSELQNIERQKDATNRLVNELDRQLRTLGDQLDTVTIDLVLAGDALAEKRAVLERRVVDIYKRGPLWTIQVLLRAESFGQLLSRYKYLYLISQRDRALVGEVDELRNRIASQRRQLLSLKTELDYRRADRGRELDRYVNLEQRRQRSLRQARASERRAATRIDSLSRAESELNAIMVALERERRRAIAAGELVGASISGADLGGLDWPLDGEVIYGYGPAPGPDGTRIRRNGIGIAAPSGTPVTTVADGVVEFANLMHTYGPSVLINHGGGFYTLYLYLSRLDVRGGQEVRRGDLIGLSGGTNSEVGPHIEFQIRQASGSGALPITLDPTNWLKRRP